MYTINLFFFFLKKKNKVLNLIVFIPIYIIYMNYINWNKIEYTYYFIKN